MSYTATYIVMIVLLSLITNVPMLLAWERQTRWNPCNINEVVILLVRTEYGKTAQFIWGYCKLYVSAAAYVLPSLIIVVGCVSRFQEIINERAKRKRKGLKKKGKVSREAAGAPNWLILGLACGYVVIAVYSSMVHLQTVNLQITMHLPDIRYILFLGLSLSKNISSLCSTSFRTALTSSERTEHVPHSRVSVASIKIDSIIKNCIIILANLLK